MSTTTPDPMRNIRPHPDGWLVKLRKQMKSYQKFFSHNKLENAQRWRNCMEKNLYKEGRAHNPRLRTFKHPNCKPENQSLPIGATYNLQKKKLSKGGYSVQLFIQIAYSIIDQNNEKKVETRRFYIGIVDQYSESAHRYALKTANAFAEEYRYCQRNLLPFYSKKYNGWKQKKLHLIPLKERALMQNAKDQEVQNG